MNGSIGQGRRNGWRLAGWGMAAGLLLLPLAAMQITAEVRWGAGDFVVMALLLGSIGLAAEVLAARANGNAYRMAAGTALAAAFLLIWINLAVGIIGDEGNPANLMFAGVLAIGCGGAIAARLRPSGMARGMTATALAQALAGGVALGAGLGAESSGWPWDVAGLTGLFTALWLLSAWLFRVAATRP